VCPGKGRSFETQEREDKKDQLELKVAVNRRIRASLSLVGQRRGKSHLVERDLGVRGVRKNPKVSK